MLQGKENVLPSAQDLQAQEAPTETSYQNR